MLKKKFNIGDRIRIKAYDDMPVDIRTRASGRLCGKVGTITDKLFSNSTGDFLYLVKLDDFDEESKMMWDAGCLELYRETIADYAFKFSAEGGRLYATIYKDGKEIGSAWSGIYHEGEYGIVQAVAYAMGVISSRMKGAQADEKN